MGEYRAYYAAKSATVTPVLTPLCLIFSVSHAGIALDMDAARIQEQATDSGVISGAVQQLRGEDAFYLCTTHSFIITLQHSTLSMLVYTLYHFRREATGRAK